jgi:T5SS/PEP-CTERM-associated repeat protein
MRREVLCRVLVSCLLWAVIAGRNTNAAAVWLSHLEHDGPLPAIDTVPIAVPPNLHRGTGILFVWTKLDAGKTLQNWSLTLTSGNDDVLRFPVYRSLTGSQSPRIYNNLKNDPNGSDLPNVHRWEYATDDFYGSDLPLEAEWPSALKQLELGGVSILNLPGRIGVGIGPEGGGDKINRGAPYHDTQYDTINDTYLLASVEYMYQLSVDEPTVDIIVELGSPGMMFTDGTEPDFTRYNARIALTQAGPSAVDDDADFDGNGIVDREDLEHWKDAFLETPDAAPSPGDADGNGYVDGADFLVWQRKVGGAITGATSSVPEPCSIVIAATLAAITAHDRRRFRRPRRVKYSDTKAIRRPRLNRNATGLLASIAAAVLALETSAQAEIYSWQNPDSGLFTDSSNWTSPGGTPGPGGPNDIINFNKPNTPTDPYTVTGVAGENSQLRVERGSLTLKISDWTLLSTGLGFGSSSVVVGASGGVANVILMGDGPEAVFQTHHTEIASTGTSAGIVTVENLEWISDGALTVGAIGVGQLNVETGSQVSSASGQIANFALEPVNGEPPMSGVTVSGADASWTVSGNLNVGNSGGWGTLTIADGADVVSGSSIVGNGTSSNTGDSSTGAATIDGDGSMWTVQGALRVGHQGGSGTIAIRNGGNASSGLAFIGGVEGKTFSQGSAVIEGAGSRWNIATEIEIGSFKSSVGKMTVRDRGALDSGGTLIVAGAGNGALSVTGGASASSTNGDIGVSFTGVGDVTVSGADSKWNNTELLRVGVAGEGQLNILRGGRMTTADAAVAFGDGSLANVFVQGANSTWTIAQNLGIGGDAAGDVPGGRGFVTVRSGGQVNVGQDANIYPRGVLRVQGGAVAGSFGTFEAANILNRGRIELSGEGMLRPTNALAILDDGVLQGNGLVDGNVINGSRVAPGFSPGIITIGGNYEQEADGVLEIEVFGVTPGVQHDQLQITGEASLAGRLDVRLDQSQYVPKPNDEITLLTATAVSNRFDAIFAPELATAAPGIALQVVPTNTAVILRFAQPQENEFNQQSTDWQDSGNWEDGVPDTHHTVELQNSTPVDRLVDITSEDAFVHQLTVGATGDGMMTVRNERNFSAINGLTIIDGGVMTLDDGTLVAPTIDVSGGLLSGNGTLVGNVTVGERGALSPGLSPGMQTIDGDFVQADGGSMHIEIRNAAEADNIRVMGSASLGGSITFDLTGHTIMESQVICFLEAEALTTENLTFSTTGAVGVTVVPLITDSTACVIVAPRSSDRGAKGDIDYSTYVDDEDFMAFMMALVARTEYENKYGPGSYQFPGDLNCDGHLNFSDNVPFTMWVRDGVLDIRCAPSTAHPVPEPRCVLLMGLAGCGALLRRELPLHDRRV